MAKIVILRVVLESNNYNKVTPTGALAQDKYFVTPCHPKSIWLLSSLTLICLFSQLLKEKSSSVSQDVETGIIRGGQTPARFFGLLSPILFQSFMMTFVAEWGDRSQLATIILASREVGAAPVLTCNQAPLLSGLIAGYPKGKRELLHCVQCYYM